MIFTLKDTLERRLFLLKLEGDGLNKLEIVKELYDKFGKAYLAALLQALTGSLLKVQNRHEQLYRKLASCILRSRATEHE